ncbi:hypothetical protein TMPK1_03420 [Rhodospirillales bacterium TMPK1]|uniref:TIGR03016 family PEP-CTERM system-associated outer membrane protein n=2 Tax=Roseiterribacter gracilis TaxID=2812848 RepID=A0A8S8X9V9_9PROT|nr:hypothetical protein TMPK1_03420 [Rhodospirillales bacterium TMPK1]
MALLAPLPMFVCATAHAEWTFTPRIEVSESFTDNAFDTDLDKRSDWITTIAPGFNLRSDGARARVNFDYQPTVRLYANQTSENNVEQRFSGTALVNPLDNFFVDARAFGTERSISGNRRFGDENAPLAENDRTQVYSYSISPFYRVHLSGTAQLEARYRFTQTATGDNQFDNVGSSSFRRFGSGADSRQQMFALTGTTGSEFGRLEARGYAIGQRIDGGGVLNNARRDRVGGEGEYHIDRSIGLIGGAGYEDVKFATFDGSGTSVRVKGGTWLGGIHWTPNADSQVRITYGRRDGINGLQANASWQVAPFVRVFGNWREGLTTSAEQIANNTAIFERDDITGSPLDEARNPLFNLDDSNFSIDNAVYRARGGRIGVTWTGIERTGMTLSAFSERRVAVSNTPVSQPLQVTRGVSFNVSREFNPYSSGNFNLGYRVRTGATGIGGDDNEWNVGVGYNRQLGDGFTAYARYSYYSRTSPGATSFRGGFRVEDDSHTNVITVGLRKTF